MLANKFYTCLAAESAAARDGAEALGSSRREFNGRREFQIDYIFGRSGEGLQIRSLSDDRFGKEKAGCQFIIVSRRAHRGCDRAIANPNLERLFDRDLIGDAFMAAVFLSANDASRPDSLHAGSSHQNAEKKRMTFSAVLLAGGESRRMGRDKATIEIEGQPLWKRQLELLRALGPKKVFVSARTSPDWLPDNVELLLDDPPSRGPLSGLTKALSLIRTTHLIALAIDMPFVNRDQLRQLLSSATAGCGVVPIVGEQAEPLAAIYPVEAASDFAAALSGPDFSLQRIVRQLIANQKIRSVSIAEANAPLYRSVNTPGDISEFNA